MSKTSKNIYIVGGSKGGVGKSIVTMAALDLLQQRGENALLIESDTSNPDVWKAYKDAVESELVNLDEADGWIRFVNLCDKNRDRLILVNTAARSTTGVTAYGGTLSSSMPELQRKVITLWVINRQRDSLELLSAYMSAMPETLIHIVRNAYYGEEAKFELYNNSNLRKTVEGKGGFSLTFPDLADRVSDDLYSQRLTIAAALNDEKRRLPLGNRAELQRWRTEVGKTLGGLFDGGA